MKSKRPSCNQMAAEILKEMRKGPHTCRALTTRIQAPYTTVKWHLHRLLENGTLSATQGPRTAKLYYLPGHEPEKAKPALEAVFDPSLNRYVQPGQPRSIERR